jgi:hypothetical protein
MVGANTRYTEATERSSMDGGERSAWGFPQCTLFDSCQVLPGLCQAAHSACHLRAVA